MRSARKESRAELACGEVRFSPDSTKGMVNRVWPALICVTKVRGSIVKTGEREATTWVRELSSRWRRLNRRYAGD
jgi:hypothetical protein